MPHCDHRTAFRDKPTKEEFFDFAERNQFVIGSFMRREIDESFDGMSWEYDAAGAQLTINLPDYQPITYTRKSTQHEPDRLHRNTWR